MKKIISICAIMLTAVAAFCQFIPNCYILRTDATGLEKNTNQAKLDILASDIATILVKPNTFKIYDYRSYTRISVIENGAEKISNMIKTYPQDTSQYFLKIISIPSKEKMVDHFEVQIKLPNDGSFTCLDQTKVELIRLVVADKINAYAKANPNANFQSAIEEGLTELKSKLTSVKSGACCPISANEIFRNLDEKGFLKYPCKILGPSNPVRGTKTNDRSIKYMNDLAKLRFLMEGQEFKPEDYTDMTSDGSSKFYITKNENYCDENATVFANIETEFASSAIYFGSWYHLWLNPDLSGNDVLFVKQVLKKNERKAVSMPNFQGGATPSPFDYTIFQRSFAPWTRFGHLPWPPPIPCFSTGLAYHRHKNSFWGDQRGFSLANSVRTYIERNTQNVTARLHQYASVRLGNSLIANDGFSSETKGYLNFFRTKYVTQSNATTSVGVTATTTEPAVEISQTATPSHVEKFGKNMKTNSLIYMQIEGSDPLVVLAPDIDCQLITYLDEISENNIKYLYVRGVLLYKGFPAYESFISDKKGKKVFLHTFGPTGESLLDYELLCPFYDYIRRFELKIRIDSAGNFLNDGLVVGIDRNTYQPIFDLGVNLIDPLSDSRLGSPNFENIFTTITNWNNDNLSKNAAGDCTSQPCEGEYPGNN